MSLPLALFMFSTSTGTAAWESALANATIFAEPRVPIARYDFIRGEPAPDAFRPEQELECTIAEVPSKGSTPKLYCTLPGGDQIKVKYGADNAEVPSELAASRLLSAIGIGTDRMYLVRRLRCSGCDADPFAYHECLRKRETRAVWETKPEACTKPDTARWTDFEDVAIERKADGERVKAPDGTGVGWINVDQLGGATAAEKDALRLAMVLIQHWDDGPDNQRLVQHGETTRLIMHDLGASFGSWRAAFDPRPGQKSRPARMTLETWSEENIFADAARCIIHRPRGKRYEVADPKAMPKPPQTIAIHEAGRRLLADRLSKLSERQLVDVFRGAGVDARKELGASTAWAHALKAKIREIQRARCPL